MRPPIFVRGDLDGFFGLGNPDFAGEELGEEGVAEGCQGPGLGHVDADAFKQRSDG